MAVLNTRDQAVELLCQFARDNQEFTSAQAFRWCFENGLPRTLSPKAMGPLFRSALIATHRVRLSGSVTSDEPQAKGRKVDQYQSLTCKYFEGDPVRAKLASLSKQFKLREIDIAEALRQAYEFGRMGRE